MRHMHRAALQVQARPFQRTSAFRTNPLVSAGNSKFLNIRVALRNIES